MNCINEAKENINKSDKYPVIQKMDETRNELLLSPRYQFEIKLNQRTRKSFDFEYSYAK